MASPVVRPLSHRILEAGALAIFLGYAVCFLYRISIASETFGDRFTVFAGLFAGYLCADLISGTAHWMGDRFWSETTPVLGPNFIAPFREHHIEPDEIVEHGVVELVGNTAIFALPVLAGTYHALDMQSGAGRSLFLAGLLLSAMVGVVVTNLFHRWAHMDQPPLHARLLQRTGLVLSRDHHARHHSGDFDRAYCITTGWMDRILDPMKVWQRIERLVGRDQQVGGS